MVQFLITLIEWFAIMALSSVGIETSAAGSCASNATARPAEYREASFQLSDPIGKPGWANIADDGCNGWMPVRDRESLPELLSPPLVYNS
jgi:hypothetical protein